MTTDIQPIKLFYLGEFPDTLFDAAVINLSGYFDVAETSYIETWQANNALNEGVKFDAALITLNSPHGIMANTAERFAREGLIERIAQDHTTKPIIVTSVEREIIMNGVAVYVPKPCTSKTIASGVRRAIEIHPATSTEILNSSAMYAEIEQ
jgi:hypothetical protein